jgi:hypothetical protein
MRTQRTENDAVVARQLRSLHQHPHMIAEYMECNPSTIYNLLDENWRAYNVSSRDLTEPEKATRSDTSVHGFFAWLLATHGQDQDAIKRGSTALFVKHNALVNQERAERVAQQVSEKQEKLRSEVRQELLAEFGLNDEAIALLNEPKTLIVLRELTR